MVAFVNVLFVPALSLWLYEKQNGRVLQPSLELLLRYCAFAAFNLPAARVLTVAAAVVANVHITVDSAYYTVAALIAAAVLPYLYTLLKKIHVEIEVSRRENAKGDKHREAAD